MKKERMYCGLCHKEFETYTRIVQVYHDYELCDEERTYPMNAHLLTNYICDECYKNLPNVVHGLILEAGQTYIEKLSERQDAAKMRYMKELKDIADKNAKVMEMWNTIKTCSLSELPADMIQDLSSLGGTYPFSKAGSYIEKAIQMEKEKITTIKNTTPFEYLGHVFIPIKQLSNEELNLKNISFHIYSDTELGMSDYEWGTLPWDYKAFYKASHESNMDIFQCRENGKLYLPGEHELFGYR